MRFSIEPRERRYIKVYGYGKKLMNTTTKTGTNFNSKYGKKINRYCNKNR